MFNLSLVIFSGLVAAAIAYNFENSVYSKHNPYHTFYLKYFLLSDNFLINEFKEVSFTRSKRLADFHHHNHSRMKTDLNCCKGDEIDHKMWEYMKEIKSECMEEVLGEESIDDMSYDPFDCEKMEKVKSDMICITECFARKANLLNDNGVMNKTVILNSLRSDGPEWRTAIAGKIVDKCLTKTKNSINIGECNADPLKIFYCIWKQLVQSCPAKLQSKSMKCKKIRAHFATTDLDFF